MDGWIDIREAQWRRDRADGRRFIHCAVFGWEILSREKSDGRGQKRITGGSDNKSGDEVVSQFEAND